MPISTSRRVTLRSSREPRGPSMPYQLPCIAARIVGCGSTAGVHSTVWILAMTAELTRRAHLYSSSSPSPG